MVDVQWQRLYRPWANKEVTLALPPPLDVAG